MAGSPGRREREALKKWLWLAGRVALTAVVTWFILDRVGLTVTELGSVGEAIARPRALPFAAASLLLMGSYALNCLIWGTMVAGLGGPSLPAVDSISIFMISSLGRYVPGKVWSIVGMAALARGKGVPVAVSTTTGVVLQALGMLAAALLGLGAFAGGPEPLPRWGVAGAGLAVAGVLLLAAIPGLFHHVVGLWFRLVRADPPRNLTAASVLRWLALVLAAWVLMGAAFWMFTTSVGTELPPVRAASAFAAAYVAGYLVLFAPAGIGVREGFLVAFLAPSLGVAPATALAIAARLWMTALEVLPAGILWVLHQRAQIAAGSREG